MAAPLTPSASDNTRGSVGSTSNRAAGANRIGKCPASSSLGQMTSDVFLCQGARVAGSCCATTPTAQYEYSSNSELRTLLTAHCSLRQRHHVPFTERATTGLTTPFSDGTHEEDVDRLGPPAATDPAVRPRFGLDLPPTQDPRACRKGQPPQPMVASVEQGPPCRTSRAHAPVVARRAGHSRVIPASPDRALISAPLHHEDVTSTRRSSSVTRNSGWLNAC